MADQLSATRRKNLLAGWAADALGAVDSFARAPFGYSNPPVQAISNLLGVPGLQRTLDRVSYGEPLTTGKGQATRLRDDTVDALGFVPLSPRTAAAVVTNGLSHAAPGVEHAATVWHGTPSEDFTKFNLDKFGKTDGGWLGKGIYGAESPLDASAYASVNGMPAGAVYRVDMDVKRPLVIDWESPNRSELLAKRRELGAEGFSSWLIANGYDGVQFLGPKNALNQAGERDIQWMALSPDQVKQVNVSYGR